MDLTSPHVENLDNRLQRPEPSYENKIVSNYLEARSEVYRDLLKVQEDVGDFKPLHGLAPVR